ncbi:MAG: hypothetical protein HOP13_04270 [Alphaproteobacteria bacterium]|nr:hypothetical protein [Alphaproteobacteria bacterium]
MIEREIVLIGLALVVLAIAAAFASALFGVSVQPSQLTIVNRSAEMVSEARLLQGGRELAVTTMEPGQIRTTDFVSRNGSLTLTVKFNSGRSASANDVGYLAAGNPVTVTFAITGDKVTLLTITKNRIGRRP